MSKQMNNQLWAHLRYEVSSALQDHFISETYSDLHDCFHGVALWKVYDLVFDQLEECCEWYTI